MDSFGYKIDKVRQLFNLFSYAPLPPLLAFFLILYFIVIYQMKNSSSHFPLFQGNFYHVLKQDEYDRGKTGFRFSFSAPS